LGLKAVGRGGRSVKVRFFGIVACALTLGVLCAACGGSARPGVPDGASAAHERPSTPRGRAGETGHARAAGVAVGRSITLALQKLLSTKGYEAQVALLPLEAHGTAAAAALKSAEPIPLLVFAGMAKGSLGTGVGEVSLSEAGPGVSRRKAGTKHHAATLQASYGRAALWFKLPKNSTAGAHPKRWLEFSLAGLKKVEASSPSVASVLWFALPMNPVLWVSVLRSGELRFSKMLPPGAPGTKGAVHQTKASNTASADSTAKTVGSWYGAEFKWSQVAGRLPKSVSYQAQALGALAYGDEGALYVEVGSKGTIQGVMGTLLEGSPPGNARKQSPAQTSPGDREGLEVVIHLHSLPHAVFVKFPSSSETEEITSSR